MPYSLPYKVWRIITWEGVELLPEPVDFPTAERYVIRVSRDVEGHGLLYLAVNSGSRPGDPTQNNTRLFVCFGYIKGKRTLGGRMAQYNFDRGLQPPP
jgi:hypothetical protein